MPRWKRKFLRWAEARSPVDLDEVKPILERVFGTRVTESAGTSHQFKISVPELTEVPEFRFGHFMICVRGGQKVIPVYLRNAFRAYELLLREGIIMDEEDDDGGDDDL